MELIRYQKTLDVHKNGTQFLLQGFETADRMSRIIEISLMASGDTIDFPLERIVAMMYVTTPGATEPSVNKCTIKDNKIIYNVLPITEEGITTMQLKLIETDIKGAKCVLASPKFAVEVTNSETNDDGEELKTTFSAIETFIAKADAAYGSRLERIELTSDCIFKAYYYDGSTYETDILQKLFLNGNVLLSESFAHGNTGVRAGEDTDNSMYYSNVSKSEALNAKSIMENSEEILEEVKLHGVYTAFQVDFTTGEVEYVSPKHRFSINKETGELEAETQRYTFAEEIQGVVNDWLTANNVVLTDLRNMVETIEENTVKIGALQKGFETRITPIELGGTGAKTAEEALGNLGVTTYQKPWNVEGPLTQINLVSNIRNNPVTLGSLSTATVAIDGITMINSGDIYITFAVYGCSSSNSTMLDVKVYINGEETFTNNGSIPKLIPLTVNKGDIIKLECTIKNNNNSEKQIGINDVRLFANMDTPYKYFSLLPGTSVISDATDAILNVLLGEGE